MIRNSKYIRGYREQPAGGRLYPGHIELALESMTEKLLALPKQVGASGAPAVTREVLKLCIRILDIMRLDTLRGKFQ